MQAVEVKSIRVNSEPQYAADLDSWYLDTQMEVGDYSEYRSAPNLVTYDGHLYGKSCWNSDRMVVVYSTAMARRYAREVKR